MTIRDERKFMDTIWDWAILDGCTNGKKVGVSDIDGIIERHGQFLVIEAKSPNAEVPVGQQILLKAMDKLDEFTVITIWGPTGTVQKMQVHPDVAKPATNDDLRRVVSWWWDKANSL